MNGTQQFVGGAGVALVALNAWHGPTHDAITAGIFHSKASKADQQTAHQALIKLALSVLFVGVATLIAGTSRTAGQLMGVFIGGLFIVWAVNRYGSTPSQSTTTKGTPHA